MQTDTTERDYLAVILIGSGSSWGRSPDKEDAIKRALRAYRDWDSLFDIYDKDVLINVVNVAGYSDCRWGGYPGGWMYGKNEATGADEPIKRKIEHVTRRMEKRRRKAR